MDVEGPQRVEPVGGGRGIGRQGDEVEVLERAQGAEVEHRAEVDVEAVEALAGEEPDAAAEVVRRRGGEVGVVRRRARPDVARRQQQVLTEHGAVDAAHLGDVGVLAAVPVVALEAFDRPVVVEEAGLADSVGNVNSYITSGQPSPLLSTLMRYSTSSPNS